ncbi:MAG: drug/metabolite transporter (DMT)-like permease [Oleispira sp.]|jgi:drug/metabolite transporter (DMT)-like permease
MRVFLFTSIALLAFAANSLLCRMALVDNAIEPLPFTLIRIISGALLLALLIRPNRNEIKHMVDVSRNKTSWLSAISLSVYAFAFSWAYVGMDTGMGALILFATIQIVLNIVAQCLGAKNNVLTLLGIIIAFTGLVVLLLPGQSAPDLSQAVIMMVAGLGWAGFVFSGRNSQQPLKEVAIAFRWSLVWCLPLVFFVDWQGSSIKGVMLASLSGTLASGLGYALWYKVLPQLGLQNAAQAQLVVPVLALVMGVLFLSEPLSLTLLLACSLILAGITLSIRSKKV